MNKREVIENNKNLLLKLINDTIICLNDTIKTTGLEYTYYCKFIQIINTVNIFEIYKWNIIKIKYVNIKKNITLNKNNNQKILKIYGNIINYYDEQEVLTINKQIQQINDLSMIQVINFQDLKIKYNELSTKKNKKILKIYKQNDEVDSMISTLCELHVELKKITHSKKINLLCL